VGLQAAHMHHTHPHTVPVPAGAQNKIKNLADKAKAYVNNVSELELKVLEATNHDPWGPHGSVMQGGWPCWFRMACGSVSCRTACALLFLLGGQKKLLQQRHCVVHASLRSGVSQWPKVAAAGDVRDTVAIGTFSTQVQHPCQRIQHTATFSAALLLMCCGEGRLAHTFLALCFPVCLCHLLSVCSCRDHQQCLPL
jgi:hypothetical protein